MRVALLFVTCSNDVPGIGTSLGGPSVTIISAGFVLTKIVAASPVGERAGRFLCTPAKFASLGIRSKAAGNLPTGLYGPDACGAAYQIPFASKYQLLSVGSKNTSQLVFTA